VLVVLAISLQVAQVQQEQELLLAAVVVAQGALALVLTHQPTTVATVAQVAVVAVVHPH
jgi:hypothetical protein